jgi:hypothetical protein
MLRLLLAASLLSVTAAAGCAHTSSPHKAEPAARRLYTVGEQRYAAGYPEQAVTLWRHAITQLPPTDDYDSLRHQLILRLAYGQLEAYQKLGKLAHLYDARRMLERYLVTHEELFGTGDKAKAERGEVYEILYEVESRMDTPPVDAGVEDVEDVDADAPDADALAQAETRPQPKRKRTQEDAEGTERVVIVDTKDRPSVDDRTLKQKLATWEPESGLVLTAPGVQPWIPARAYVRMDGFAKRVDGESGAGAHATARRVLQSLRPALRACYDGAFARAPADFHLAKVELTVGADGSLEAPRIVGGMVGDPIGDACVLERLGAGKIADGEAVEPMRVAIGLLFFYDGAVMFNEGSGGTVRNELDLMAGAMSPRASTEPPRALPPITQ